VIRYIDAHRQRFGVEPILEVLEVAPSTYYSAKSRPACRRRVNDEKVKCEIRRVFDDNYRVYGARKLWRQLNREGIPVARCTVERLMRQMGLAGRVRGARRRTTIPAETSPRPADLVERRFTASRPNALWVADITYVATWSGFAYAAFVVDVFSRRIVGWRVASTLRASLALDGLEMAIWSRNQRLDGLVHHSDRGGQYLSILYTERLAAEGVVTSVGSRGDSYDNALAESVIGLYKSELIFNRGPWRIVEEVELPRWRGSTGGTPPGSTRRSETFLRTSSRLLTTLSNSRPWRPVSTKPSLRETRGGSMTPGSSAWSTTGPAGWSTSACAGGSSCGPPVGSSRS
jgi:putative transposase